MSDQAVDDAGADTATESDTDVAEWQAEAEKWKAEAAKQEQRAQENEGAADHATRLEASVGQQEAEAAKLVAEAKESAAAEAEQVRAEGERTAAEWQAEAEKWQALARKHEDRAKENYAAAQRLEKLEADKATSEEKSKAEAVDLEAKASEAEARALRYEVAQEMGVPAELSQFLTGTSKKELEDQADRLLASIDLNPPAPDEPDDDDKTPEPDEERRALEAKAAAAEARALRYEVAAQTGLRPELIEFLSATSREDLTKQAEVLLAVSSTSERESSTRARMPTRDLRPGALPEGFDPEPDPGELAAKILRQQRGY